MLFLCNHNSARSILAEAMLNHIGRGRFRAYSAGCDPRADGRPHPLSLQVLESAGIATDGLRSKSWGAFAAPDAPHMDLIITVCGDTADEICPVWPGHPATAHWGYPDPTVGHGSDAEELAAFRHTLHALHQRLELLLNLPPDKLQRSLLQESARGLVVAR